MSATLKRIIALSAALFGMAATQAHAETIVSVTQTSYDTNGRPVCSATRMNPAIYASLPSDPCTLGTTSTTYGDDRITKTIYDTAGQATQVIQAYGTSVQRVYSTVAYSNNGQVTDQIDANGNRSHMVYDGVDRLKELDYPSTTRPSAFNPATQATALSTAGAYSTTDYEQYAYDDKNNQTYRRRRDAQVLNDCFDALGRVTVHYVHAQSGCTATGGAGDVYTTYDGLGRIVTKRFASTAGTGVTYYYDGLGRMNATTDMNGRSIWLGYSNPNSALNALVYPDGLGMTFGRDALGRATTATWAPTSTVLFTQTFDNTGNRTQLNRGSGAAVTNYTYDAFGRVSTFNDDVSGTANDITWTFSARNPAKQIVTWGASSTVYDYKETTNTTVNQTYDGLNRDAAIAAVSGGYDARGNLTKDATRTMTYDVENRLLTTVGTGVNLALVYDPEGRLAKYSTDGGTTYTTFAYFGTNLIAEYDNAGTMLRRYIHGDGVDEPIVWFEGAGTTDKRYLIANYQGSIIGYTDSAGTLATVYKYGPYGEPKDISNNDSWSGARFRYTGQTMLPEARLYYYKARVYDPIYGHFLQTDPVGSKDDFDLYAYVGGDPINKIDPTGLLRCDRTQDDRCDSLHESAEVARERLADAIERIIRLKKALKSGATLTAEEQQDYDELVALFGSVSSSRLSLLSNQFGAMYSAIGAEGKGAKVIFDRDPNSNAVMRAGFGSRTLNVYAGYDSGAKDYNEYYIRHEAAHMIGITDQKMPNSAPLGLGRESHGGGWNGWVAQGRPAALWLGANSPGKAANNSDNYQCFVGECFGN